MPFIIYIFTEDKNAKPLEILIQKMLRLVDSECQLQEPLIEFVILDQSGGGMWWATDKPSTTKKRDKIRLVQTIATAIASSGDSFVCFHFDADCTWSDVYNEEGQADTSQWINWQKFNKKILCEIRDRLAGVKVTKAKGLAFPTAENIENQIQERLFAITPFYSIESWLYQNTQHAQKICNFNHKDIDAKKFKEWEECRTKFDEILQPKEETFLRDKYNLELAENTYPAKAAYNAQRSFYQCVCQMEQSWALLEALYRTRRR